MTATGQLEAPARRYGGCQLLRFGWLEVQCCLFAVAIFVGLALSKAVPLPIARYDALLVYGLVVTVVFFLLRLETGREVAVIFGFHLIGLALELFKVRVGSWSYPEAVGGFWVVDVPSHDAALEWAARTAVACRCAQEVREFMPDPAVGN